MPLAKPARPGKARHLQAQLDRATVKGAALGRRAGHEVVGEEAREDAADDAADAVDAEGVERVVVAQPVLELLADGWPAGAASQLSCGAARRQAHCRKAAFVVLPLVLLDKNLAGVLEIQVHVFNRKLADCAR